MANLSNGSRPTLGFTPDTTLGEYAGKLEKAASNLGGKVSKKQADTLRQDIISEGGLRKAVNLTRDYLLKGASAGKFGDRLLGQLGLSIGGKISIKQNSLLGQTGDELFGVHYRKSGFPYRKDNLIDTTTKTLRDGVIELISKEDPNALTKAMVLTKDIPDEFKRPSYNQSLGISQAWIINPSTELSAGTESLSNEVVKNSQRRLSLVVYKNYPGNDRDILELPYVPQEFNWTPTNKYVEIAAFGRNVPDYQYLGSSQEFSFEIDWYSNEGNYEGIVAMAKSVDAYSRSNGYNDNPPLVQLVGLFGYDQYFFYIKQAPYRVVDKTGKVGGGVTIYPRQIIQTVTLQRVADTNPKWETYNLVNGNSL